MNGSDIAWWQDFDLPVGEHRRWQLGPLTVWLRRREGEWRAAFESSGQPLDDRLELGVPFELDEVRDKTEVHRFVVSGSDGTVRFLPKTADRSMVIRPETTLHVPPGQSAVVYVSVPLWTQVYLSTMPIPMFELPMNRPSDTWFGSNTVQGELCYASRTKAMLDLDDIPFRPSRARAAVHIDNRAETELIIKHINLPVPYLSVICDEQDRLWTESILVESTSGTSPDRVEIMRGPPREAPGARVLSPPRIEDSTGLLERAFGGILG